jgi:hypothetical protein
MTTRLDVEQLQTQLAEMFAILVGRRGSKGIVAATFNPQFYTVTYREGNGQVTVRMDWSALWLKDTP